MKPKLVILAGPTAVGKSAMAVKLAKKINGEIISADSMQVYRGMNIGSAKITEQEMDGVRHYLIDELEANEEFNIVLFQTLAKKYIQEICSKGKIPIMVGGTGFYIQSVLYDIHFDEHAASSAYRDELMQIAEEKGANVLHQMLSAVDPEAAEQIHEHNIKRVIRALEYHHLTGACISRHNEEEHQNEPAYNACYFVLNDERARIYERIEKRIDQMLQDGLIEEVRTLKNQGCTREMTSMQGLGYKEILAYLDHECTLEEAVSILKRDTRHFAKRQLTWFKREKNCIWIQMQDYSYDDEKILAAILSRLQEQFKNITQIE